MFKLASSLPCVVSMVVVALTFTGCGGDGLVRGPVKGQVTVGGRPLAKGRILFLPTAPNEGPTVSALIVNGEYSLPEGEGPVAGPNRVEVEAEVDLGFAIDDEAAFAQHRGRVLPINPIPPAFNRNSNLALDVKPDKENVFDVTVPVLGYTASATSR